MHKNFGEDRTCNSEGIIVDLHDDVTPADDDVSSPEIPVLNMYR